MVIASQQLQQPGTRLLLFLVYQEENLRMKHKRHSGLLLSLAHMLRWIVYNYFIFFSSFLISFSFPFFPLLPCLAFPSTHVKVDYIHLLYFLLFPFLISPFPCLSHWLLFSNLRFIYGGLSQEKWAKNLYIASVCYGRTVS